MKYIYMFIATVGCILFSGSLGVVSVGAISCETSSSSEVVSEALVDSISGEFYAYVDSPTEISPLSSVLTDSTLEYDKCSEIGSVSLASTPSLAGELKLDGSPRIISLISNTNPDTLLASPNLTLVASNPNCTEQSCTATYEGSTYELLPKKLSSSFDSLNIFVLKPVSGKARLTSVSYFQDSKQLYQSKSVEKFDYRYVSAGEHTLSTLLEFTDGSVMRQQEKFSQEDNVFSYILPIILRHQGYLRLGAYIVGLLSMYWAAILSVRKYIEHRRWKRAHFAPSEAVERIPSSSQERYAQAKKTQDRRRDMRFALSAIMVPLVLLSIFFVLNTWFVAIFTVDGISMETTLHDRERKVLLKYPILFSRINRSTYQPKRGEVIVFEKLPAGLSTEFPTESDKLYLVKRVLALPGERVVLKGTDITVYNTDQPNGFSPDRGATWQNVISSTIERRAEVTLKEGEIFVVGDDRDYSTDSRDFGPISINNVQGRVLYQDDPSKKPYIYDESGVTP